MNGEYKAFYTALPFRNLETVDTYEHLDFDDASKLLDGWVYVLSNVCMPGIYKIGMTKTWPERRAKEISSATGVPTPFKVERAFHVKDPASVEKRVHQDLSCFRVSNNREFFELDLEDIYETIHQYEAWVHGDCRPDIFVNKKLITKDKYASQTKRIKITESLYERLEEGSFGDLDAVVEGLLRLVVDQLNCVIYFENGEATALPSGEYSESFPAETEDKPQIIKTIDFSQGFQL